MIRQFAISAVSALTLLTGAAWAEGEVHIEDVAYSFEGPFGAFDTHQLQRGLQVFTEVCSACHGLKFLRIGALADQGGPMLPEAQVKAYAKTLTVIDKDSGEERPASPADLFPKNDNAVPKAPDMSVMAKARAGFHGPMGLGINQFVKGMGGPEHIYSVLTGYTGEEKVIAGSTFYENRAFPGGWIAMPPPLTADQVAYADGTETSVENYSEDVAAFLMWAAEPKMMVRKESGFKAVLLLGLLSVLLYLTNKKLWSGVKGRKKTV